MKTNALSLRHTLPEYALSEFAQSMIANLSILKNQTEDVLCPSFVNKLEAHFQRMSECLNALDNKTSSIPTTKDAKKVVKSLAADTTMDETMETFFKYLVRCLLCRSIIYLQHHF